MAFGIVRRLILDVAAQLPLASDPGDIWSRWEVGGVPAGAALAPALLARVEEYRWRRGLPVAPAVGAAPLFEQPASDAAPPAPVAEPTPSDLAYLDLCIADRARSTALGLPLLPPAELPPSLLRALLLDIAAQDMALVGDGGGRAGDMAHAIDTLLAGPASASIDLCAQRYSASLQAIGILGEAAAEAVAGHDWLAVTALLAAASGAGLSRVAAALLAADDAAITAAMAALGVSADGAAPLIDALADVPGRPDRAAAALVADTAGSTAAMVAARASHLRGLGA